MQLLSHPDAMLHSADPLDLMMDGQQVLTVLLLLLQGITGQQGCHAVYVYGTWLAHRTHCLTYMVN